MSEDTKFDMFDTLGADIVEALDGSDYGSPEELVAAQDGDIQAIKGIGPATVRKIRILMAEAGIAEDPDAALPEAAPAPLSNLDFEPSDVAVGPAPDESAGKVALRATKNMVLKWQGQKYNVVIGQEVDHLPADLVDHLKEREEAQMLPPRGK